MDGCEVGENRVDGSRGTEVLGEEATCGRAADNCCANAGMAIKARPSTIAVGCRTGERDVACLNGEHKSKFSDGNLRETPCLPKSPVRAGDDRLPPKLKLFRLTHIGIAARCAKE